MMIGDFGVGVRIGGEMGDAMHVWKAWLLLGVAILLLGIGLFPQWGEATDPETADLVRETTLGFRFSPVYRSVRREMAGPARLGFTAESKINLLSWSGLLVLVGMGCAVGALRRLREGCFTQLPG